MFGGKLRNGRLLALSCHCLDVALLFRVLAVSPLVRRRLETAAHTSLRDSKQVIFLLTDFASTRFSQGLEKD